MCTRRCLAGLLILLMVIAGRPNGIAAQDHTMWTDLGIYGGDVQGLAVDPADSDRIYAATYLGRVLFYCTAARLDDHMEERDGEGNNHLKYHKLLEIMDACIQQRCVTRSGTPWLSQSAAMLQRDPSHLLY